jgi:hypothetical protein
MGIDCAGRLATVAPIAMPAAPAPAKAQLRRFKWATALNKKLNKPTNNEVFNLPHYYSVQEGRPRLRARHSIANGCVRMPRDLAAMFFERVHTGTPVTVVGSTQNLTCVRKAIPISPQDH